MQKGLIYKIRISLSYEFKLEECDNMFVCIINELGKLKEKKRRAKTKNLKVRENRYLNSLQNSCLLSGRAGPRRTLAIKPPNMLCTCWTLQASS